jgi:proteasome accessory factor C
VSRAAAGGARDQVARLLTLVPYLHHRGEVHLEEASAALGVPVGQLVKDLRVLLMCGLPGGFPDDLIDVDLDVLEGADPEDRDPEGPAEGQPTGVIRVSNADYLARPLRLTATEASAVIVALRALRNGADEETAPIVDRALAKLEAAAAEGGASAAQIDPGVTPDELAGLRSRLGAAIAAGTQVRLTYWVPSRDEESRRLVDPISLATAHGFDYLDAWCHRAGAPRLFRLDRIHHAEVLDSPVVARLSPRAFEEGLFGLTKETGTLVTLRLAPHASWVPEYYPVEAVRRRAGGHLEIDLLVGDEQWLERLLLRLAPWAEVLDPASLSERFRDSAQATLRLYSGSDVASQKQQLS